MPKLRRPQDPAALAWLAVCLGGFLVLCWLQRHFVTDDAWITARYADNLAEGLDFGWNPSSERSEGISKTQHSNTSTRLHSEGLQQYSTLILNTFLFVVLILITNI